MKRILPILIVLMLAGPAWGETYYMDKRCTYEGNGSAASCAASLNADGAFKSFTRANDSTYVAAGADHTVNIVAGSGPYYPADAMRLNVGYIYPTQNNAANTITWNFNGNAFQSDFNVNTASYSWVQSGASGKTTWYYLQAAGGGQPQIPATHNCCSTCNGGAAGCGATALTEVKSVTIGDHIYGDWNSKGDNLVNGAISYKANNWAWGDYDSLGYSTLYVHLSGDANPATSGVEIWVAARPYGLRSTNGYVGTILNDAVLSGGNDDTVGIVRATGVVVLNRCTLANCQIAGMNVDHVAASGSAAYFSKFINAGHRGIEVAAQANVTAYNNYFDRVHLGIKFTSDTEYTVTAKNNIFHKIYSGAVQKDVATPTFTESNNIFHLDPLSTHGGKSIAFTTGTRQWETTAASDFPASTATTNTTGTDPLVNHLGILTSGSPGRGTGVDLCSVFTTATDFSGNTVCSGGAFVGRGAGMNIGAYQNSLGGLFTTTNRFNVFAPHRRLH